jgi:hypothetical protein
MSRALNNVKGPKQVVVSLTFDAPSLAEGERLRRALRRSALRVAGQSVLRQSSYASNAPAGTAEDVDE